MKRFLFIFCFLFLWIVSFATDHYGITGTTWGAGGLLTWAASSGGPGTLNDPTSSDRVFLDANSASISVSGSPVCGGLICTGYTGTLTHNVALLDVYGNLTLGSGMSLAGFGTLRIRANSSLTCNGISFPFGVRVLGTGITVTLQDAFLSTSVLRVEEGTLNANNFAVSISNFDSNYTTTRTITMGSGLWTLSGTQWDISATTGLTFNKNTANLKFTSTSAIAFSGGGLTYNDVWFAHGSGTGTITITGTNTFSDLKDDGTGTHSIVFPNVTTTVTTFSISGTSGHLITLARTGGSGTWTISQASGAVCRDYLSISNSAATGGATWNAGANSTDGGGNTGWVFTACSTGSYRFFFKP